MAFYVVAVFGVSIVILFVLVVYLYLYMLEIARVVNENSDKVEEAFRKLDTR